MMIKYLTLLQKYFVTGDIVAADKLLQVVFYRILAAEVCVVLFRCNLLKRRTPRGINFPVDAGNAALLYSETEKAALLLKHLHDQPLALAAAYLVLAHPVRGSATLSLSPSPSPSSSIRSARSGITTSASLEEHIRGVDAAVHSAAAPQLQLVHH
jgi:hypothetical protein